MRSEIGCICGYNPRISAYMCIKNGRLRIFARIIRICEKSAETVMAGLFSADYLSCGFFCRFLSWFAYRLSLLYGVVLTDFCTFSVFIYLAYGGLGQFLLLNLILLAANHFDEPAHNRV